MLRSLQGMRAVLREGGLLVIESRNREKLLADRVRFTHFGLRERGGIRCIPLYVWNFGREFHEPLVVEVVFVFEQQGEVQPRTYDITYQPFHTEQLHSLLKHPGFTDLTTDWTSQAHLYRVVASAGTFNPYHRQKSHSPTATTVRFRRCHNRSHHRPALLGGNGHGF